MSAPVPSHRPMFDMRVNASEYIRSACIRDNNRGQSGTRQHDNHVPSDKTRTLSDNPKIRHNTIREREEGGENLTLSCLARSTKTRRIILYDACRQKRATTT